MLAYRHAFHAGMHADVLKHLMLVQTLRYMAEKDKPYTYLDTHAGAGAYALDTAIARKTGEFAHGIGRLWARKDLPPAVADYVDLVRRFNGPGALVRYPGSPAVALLMRRADDRLRLYELHPTDHRLLEDGFGAEAHTHIAKGDGYASLKAELPPPSRRSVTLIDPSYEIKTDYTRVAQAMQEALTRFAQGLVLVWYPQLLTRDSQNLPLRLRKIADDLAPRGWLHVRLTVQAPDEHGFGLIGSGMFIANPPFVLHDALRTALPFLAGAMGQIDEPTFLLEQRAA